MGTASVNRAQLSEAGVLNLDLRPHAAAPIWILIALTLVSQPRAAFARFTPEQSQTLTAPSAEAGVRDTLQKYSAALESLDASAVKRVQPSIPVDNLAKTFKDMKELKVNIDEVRVLSMDGASARVSCRVTQTLTPKAGSRKTTAVTRVMRLRRLADSWVIDTFER
jgi:hypothetical protein